MKNLTNAAPHIQKWMVKTEEARMMAELMKVREVRRQNFAVPQPKQSYKWTKLVIGLGFVWVFVTPIFIGSPLWMPFAVVISGVITYKLLRKLQRNLLK